MMRVEPSLRYFRSGLNVTKPFFVTVGGTVRYSTSVLQTLDYD